MLDDAKKNTQEALSNIEDALCWIKEIECLGRAYDILKLSEKGKIGTINRNQDNLGKIGRSGWRGTQQKLSAEIRCTVYRTIAIYRTSSVFGWLGRLELVALVGLDRSVCSASMADWLRCRC